MAVYISSLVKYYGTYNFSSVGDVETVLSIPTQSGPYIVEGWLDVSALQPGEYIVFYEYISIAGGPNLLYNQFVVNGSDPWKAWRITPRTFSEDTQYILQATLNASATRSINYRVLAEILATS